jgi:23S rRNA pseudouridine2604 synthase
MCKTEGYDVVSLKRTRVIDVKLANLKPGEYRELTETEKKSLYHKCGL